MTAALLNRFRTILEAKRQEISRDVRSRLSGMEVEPKGDPMDAARELADRDSSADEVVRKSVILGQVEEALQRIESGCFGECLACGRPLARQRIEILPWARYCVDCQALSERAHAEVRRTQGALGD